MPDDCAPTLALDGRRCHVLLGRRQPHARLARRAKAPGCRWLAMLPAAMGLSLMSNRRNARCCRLLPTAFFHALPSAVFSPRGIGARRRASRPHVCNQCRRTRPWPGRHWPPRMAREFPRAVTAQPGMDASGLGPEDRQAGRRQVATVRLSKARRLGRPNPDVHAHAECGPGELLAAAGKFILRPLHPKPVLAGSTHSSSSGCVVPPPFSSGEFP
jgi:hypothetical protein